ncbi:MAG: hypothetical protein V4714_14715 [Bacteroidota bacterium]
MELSNSRKLALEKLSASIKQSLTLEQLLSTEQYFARYYNQYSFESSYLQQEWKLDSLIRAKKQELILLEGEQTITFDKRKPSLKRLEAYLSELSLPQIERMWPELKMQLSEISSVEISHFPAICQILAHVPFTESDSFGETLDSFVDQFSELKPIKMSISNWITYYMLRLITKYHSVKQIALQTAGVVLQEPVLRIASPAEPQTIFTTVPVEVHQSTPSSESAVSMISEKEYRNAILQEIRQMKDRFEQLDRHLSSPLFSQERKTNVLKAERRSTSHNLVQPGSVIDRTSLLRACAELTQYDKSIPTKELRNFRLTSQPHKIIGKQKPAKADLDTKRASSRHHTHPVLAAYPTYT